jgi:hypothetical protein
VAVIHSNCHLLNFPSNPDAIPDYLNVDVDNDGIYDFVEANFVLSGKDFDSDGLDRHVSKSFGVFYR